MRKLLTISIIVFYSFISYGQNMSRMDILFNNAFDNHDYDLCVKYIRTFSSADTLSYTTILNSAKCLLSQKQYDECINFCNEFGPSYLDAFNDGMFDGYIGASYYLLNNYKQALIYMRHFITSSNEIGNPIDSFYVGLYAHILHSNHRYQEAELYFDKYFEMAFAEDGVNWNNCQGSRRKEVYAYKFYIYAYNSIYLGNEAKGKTYLELSMKCGDKKATNDFYRLSASPTFAKEYEINKTYISSFEEAISKYDIKRYLSKTYTDNPGEFWNLVTDHSISYQELLSAYNKTKVPKALADAMVEINESRDGMDAQLAQQHPYKASDFEQELLYGLYGQENRIKDFRVFPGEDINAYATPYGHIYLTEGLLDRYHFNENLILGVCAHEATHYECRHSLIQSWKQKDRERKDAIWGGVAAGVYAGTMAVSGMTMAANGVSPNQSYWDNTVKQSLLIVDAFNADAYYFKFSYSREQELESDIIAYRFCEAIGISGYAYILALELLGDNDFYIKPYDTDYHPTTAYRVLLLKYLFAKDHPNKDK